MAKITLSVCAKTCRDIRPNRCCEPMYCEMAINYANDQGVTLDRTDHPTLPLMDSENRCTAPAHLRPICSAHQCDINSLGFFKRRPELTAADALKLTDRYFVLRDKTSVDVDIDEQYERGWEPTCTEGSK